MREALQTSLFFLLAISTAHHCCDGAVPRSLQGKWVLIEVHQQDQIVKVSDESSECTITKDELILRVGTLGQNYQLHVDPSTTPPQINSALKTDNGNQVSPGIYNIVGNQLRICFAVPGRKRPQGFSAHIGEPHFMWVFKRHIDKPPFTKNTDLTPAQSERLNAASDHLQGTWEIVSMEWDGRIFPGKVSGKIVIHGDKATSFGGEKPVTYSLEIDPNVSPPQLNLLMTADNELQIKQCIYKIEGDTLSLCHHFKSNQARPEEFQTRASDGLLLTRLKKQSIQQTGN
ncbi:TIGR03067 domain-containing protein [Planctomycetaceae bacterium]|jgi:uncharacterized protein (TIGR03067 family)|nr:TIGR03067 domain-containing protein [Planctomycetaceae bacterium]